MVERKVQSRKVLPKRGGKGELTYAEISWKVDQIHILLGTTLYWAQLLERLFAHCVALQTYPNDPVDFDGLIRHADHIASDRRSSLGQLRRAMISCSEPSLGRDKAEAIFALFKHIVDRRNFLAHSFYSEYMWPGLISRRRLDLMLEELEKDCNQVCAHCRVFNDILARSADQTTWETPMTQTERAQFLCVFPGSASEGRKLKRVSPRRQGHLFEPC